RRRRACTDLRGAADRTNAGRDPDCHHCQSGGYPASHQRRPSCFCAGPDPVAQGFVASLPKPSGNLTGFSGTEFSVGGKWLDLLKGIPPGLARVAIIFNPDTAPQSKLFTRSIEAVASSLQVRSANIRLANTHSPS